MKKVFFRGIALLGVLCLLSGCVSQKPLITQPSTLQTTEASTPETTTLPVSIAPTEESTVATTEAPTEPSTEPPTDPEHSALYLPWVSTEDMILYFNEVCLNAEMVNAGDPTKLQKWATPIRYICIGSYTDTDKKTLDTFADWLNTVEGFPGMEETQDYALANMRIYFCEPEDYLATMGDQFAGTDGGVTFWYNNNNEIFDAMIGYRTDLDQEIRNSVILEEIYNGLGPINDTQLRMTSVIYSEFSTPQSLSQIDEVIMKLLYHPKMQCGMDTSACEAVIRQLYY